MNALYHDRQTYTSVLDLQRGEDSLALEEEERMAEDLRLLYVAITRSVFHCSVGIAPLYTRGRSKGNSDVHRSAMGYLLQKGQAGDAQALLQSLEAFAQGSLFSWLTLLALTTRGGRLLNFPQTRWRRGVSFPPS